MSEDVQPKGQRVLFIGIEFVDPNFSGNGVYSRTIVKSLLSLNKVDVHVLCGRPDQDRNKDVTLSSHDLEQFMKNDRDERSGKLSISTVPLKTWKKLGSNSSWEQLADVASTNGQIQRDISSFDPTVIFGVDWTSYQVYRRLKTNIPFYYFVFRTFSAEESLTKDERQWYIDKELEAQYGSSACIVLSAVDKKWNVDKFSLDRPMKCMVLNPPLRQDFLELYNVDQELRSAPTCKTKRKYITCCSRLEPSKRPDRFVSLVCAMSDFLKERKLVPLLIGSVTDPSYANELMNRMKESFNIDREECLIMGFKKDPADLKNIWINTILNIHPALYESYGMTIIEASTFAAPTLLDSNASIGAEDLLHGPNRFSVDMSDIPKATTYLKKLLADEILLFQTGLQAQQIAVKWDDKEHSKAMQNILDGKIL